MTLVTGNTYPVKDQIKRLGGKWDADAKGWMVPDDKAEQAKQLVAGAPKSTYRGRRSSGKWTGCACGSREGESRASDCFTCQHDA